MTLKKPVLLLHSENMVTLDMVYYCSITAKNENENRKILKLLKNDGTDRMGEAYNGQKVVPCGQIIYFCVPLTLYLVIC